MSLSRHNGQVNRLAHISARLQYNDVTRRVRERAVSGPGVRMNRRPHARLHAAHCLVAAHVHLLPGTWPTTTLNLPSADTRMQSLTLV